MTRLIICFALLFTSALSRHHHHHHHKKPPVQPPINDLSQDVKFYLYTRQNPDDYQTLLVGNLSSVKSSNFNAAHKTTIVVHGYMSNILSDLDQYIKKDLLKREEHNVIGVDWSALSETILYNVAAQETLEVGQYVAAFIKFMQTAGLNLNDVHLIGHSLGAHVVGFAGKTMAPARLPRITGLDPAKPSFENAGPSGRIDVGDAVMVDCIHTCAGSLGLGKPVCLLDFYPNGGENFQPGCPIFDIIGVCSHGRSYAYYGESIDLTHKFEASICTKVPITNPDQYCVPSAQLMGDPANASIPGLFYLTTNTKFPYSQDVVSKHVQV